MMEREILKAIRMARAVSPSAWIATFCVACVLFLTVLPVETGCSAAEKYLCLAVPVTAVMGLAISVMRRIRIRISPADWIAGGWYLYAMGMLWLDAAYPAAAFAARATMMLLLYASFRILFSSSRLKWEGIALLLVIFAIAEAFMGYSQLISGASRHYLYPVTGSFLNPGPYSAYLATGVVLACDLKRNLIDNQQPATNNHQPPTNLSIVVLTVLLVPLVMTMSRAAFLALAVCLLLLYKDRIKGWKHFVFLIAGIAAAAIALYFVKSGSADGRSVINFIGARCIMSHPLVGSGIGSFFYRYALQTAGISAEGTDISLTRADVIDYSFNDLLLVGVEQGLVGLAFALVLIAVVLRRLWRGSRPLFLAALSLLIISLFSYPFELLPYQIVAAVIAAYAGTAKMGKAESDEGYNKWRELAKGVTITVGFCVISAWCYHYVHSRITAERDYRMMSGLHDKAFTKDYYSLLPYLSDDKRFLFDFARLLSDQQRYNDSNDMLRCGELVSNDPMFIVLQGNNYRHMEAFDEAEAAYIRAWHTMPNRIYPLYCLMKLHEQLDNAEKASEYAKQIVSFKEKIPSPAVAEMKTEAREIDNRITDYQKKKVFNNILW